MRKWLLSVFFGAWLAGPGAAVPSGPPSVQVQGIMESPAGNYAIVVSPRSTAVARQGARLGDYTLNKISGHEVVFAYGEQSWTLPLVKATSLVRAPLAKPEQGLPDAPKVHLELANADAIQAVRLVCRAVEVDVVSGPEVLARVSFSGDFTPSEAVAQILAGGKWAWTLHQEVLVTTAAGRLAAVLKKFDENLVALGKAPAPPIQCDLVGAELATLCEICAKEMKVSLTGLPPQGRVTFFLHRCASEALAWACALQPTPLAVARQADTLQFP